MGALMSLINQNSSKSVDIILNFEGAEPQSEEEREIHAAVAAVLNRGPEILEQLTSYPGCEDYIRKAITTPGPENEDAAWNAVLPAVDQLKEFYDFSLELEESFPKLLLALCKSSPKESLASQEALAKQLADVFDFVLRFDDAKMVNPAIQNDFSYYRRTLNRMKLSKKDTNLTIRDELANRMSLFFAYPTPMMNALSETTVNFLREDSSVPRENVTDALATMANVCQHMVEIKKFSSETTNLFCLRAMTGAIILFDHLHQQGAFHKKSPINMRGCISVLKNFTGASSSSGTSPSAGLLNALRFTTKHLNDPETPAHIKQLLA
ncbi:CYFIP related Rac1 interactor B [Balamuthia mandrillaris]